MKNLLPILLFIFCTQSSFGSFLRKDVYIQCDVRQVLDFNKNITFSRTSFDLGRKGAGLSTMTSRTFPLAVHKLKNFFKFFSNNLMINAQLDKNAKKITIKIHHFNKGCNCEDDKVLSSLEIDYRNGIRRTDLYYLSSQIDGSLNDLLVKCSVRNSSDVKIWE